MSENVSFEEIYRYVADSHRTRCETIIYRRRLVTFEDSLHVCSEYFRNIDFHHTNSSFAQVEEEDRDEGFRLLFAFEFYAFKGINQPCVAMMDCCSQDCDMMTMKCKQVAPATPTGAAAGAMTTPTGAGMMGTGTGGAAAPGGMMTPGCKGFNQPCVAMGGQL